jgi:nucleoside 2-deoxyribosyltransferase
MPNTRPPSTNLHCFVAMAFGHTDADAVYDSVRKALKPIGIMTCRVDRIEHNDDIDKRIIAEIEAADFVLADLTYARPSVYFEAGYAQRSIPVIYIARQDHFKDKADDPNGNLRVHFDLQMRNIVPWSSGRDRTFLKRLKARVKKVIAPLLTQRKTQLESNRQIKAFDRLSFQDKWKSLVKIAKAHFAHRGYTLTDLTFPIEKAPATIVPMASRIFPGATIAMKLSRGVFHSVFLHVPHAITAQSCDIYQRYLLRHPLYTLKVFQPPTKVPKQIKDDILICSFGSGGLNRLRKRISYLHAGDYDQTLVHDMPFTIIKPGREIEVPRRIAFHIFESNPRLLALEPELKQRF